MISVQKIGPNSTKSYELCNRRMLECDIVVFLFFKKVGDYTKEEFDVAYEHFKRGNNPRCLYVFFKSEKVDIDEIDEGVFKVRKIKDEIKDTEQIYNKFNSSEDLILQLKKQLELVIPDIY